MSSYVSSSHVAATPNGHSSTHSAQDVSGEAESSKFLIQMAGVPEGHVHSTEDPAQQRMNEPAGETKSGETKRGCSCQMALLFVLWLQLNVHGRSDA